MNAAADPRWKIYECEVQVRVARRFREHVLRYSKPTAVIVRQKCQACKCEPYRNGHALTKRSKQRARTDIMVEAHHPDYSNPWVVYWLCNSCHRSVERNPAKVARIAPYDYSGIVRTRKGAQVQGCSRCGGDGNSPETCAAKRLNAADTKDDTPPF